jgi:predicted GTPase
MLLAMKTVRELDADTGVTKEVTETGVPILIPVSKWDIREEINDMESYREHVRDLQSQFDDS